MKKMTGICFILLIFISDFATGQVLTIAPTQPSPSSLFVLTPSAAGIKPGNPQTNYTGQSITYEFPTGWGNIGVVNVNSTSIPSGVTIIIEASNGLGGTEGVTTGPVTVSTVYTPIIDGIAKVKKQITRQLTQSMLIPDANFAQLHAGQYTVTINLWLH